MGQWRFWMQHQECSLRLRQYGDRLIPTTYQWLLMRIKWIVLVCYSIDSCSCIDSFHLFPTNLGADLDITMQSMRDRLEVEPLLLQLPLGSEDKFQGIIDLIGCVDSYDSWESWDWTEAFNGHSERVIIYKDDKGSRWSNQPLSSLSSTLLDKAKDARETLVGTLLDHDEELLAACLESNGPCPGTGYI